MQNTCILRKIEMQFIFITAPWWLNSKQSSKSNSKSKKGANAKQLFCKECLLGNRKYYTISNGMPSDIERHRKSKQHSEATIATVLSTSEEGRDLLERKRSATGAKKRPSNDESIGVSPPKQARIDVEVENVEESQYPQDKGGISADVENPSQREDTQEGNGLLIDDNTIYDSINDVLDTVTSGSESELEMISHSKSQSNIKDFLSPQGKTSNITSVLTRNQTCRQKEAT